MKDLYQISGISKQGLHKHRMRQHHKDEVTGRVVEECNRMRTNHRRMGCRRIYASLRKDFPVGRDLFERIGFENGFKLKVIRNRFKTTWASKTGVFPNLLEGVTLTNMNQAIQSDIFYFNVEGRSYYGVTHIDVYTRRLLSVHGSPSLEACQTAMALDKVIRCRGVKALKGCIYHSDRGTQYTSEAVKSKVRELGMRQSMCTLAQENAYAERVQGTIKNEYLEYEPLKKANYQRKLERIMWLYNNERPHTCLGNMTPVQYEKHIQSIPESERPKLTVYRWQNPLLTPGINQKQINKTSTNQKSTEINYL